MHTILFVCTGNQYRSPIAAAVFRDQLKQNGKSRAWSVKSAGTWTSPGKSPPPEAMQLARLHGVAIDGHLTRVITASMITEADLIIVMEEGHQEALKTEFQFARQKVHLLSQVVEGINYDIPDPAPAKENRREIIGDLVAIIRKGYLKICRIVETD